MNDELDVMKERNMTFEKLKRIFYNRSTWPQHWNDISLFTVRNMVLQNKMVLFILRAERKIFINCRKRNLKCGGKYQ